MVNYDSKEVTKQNNEEVCFSNEFIRFSNAVLSLSEFEMDVFLYLCAKAKYNCKVSPLNCWEHEFAVDMSEFVKTSNRKKKWSKYNSKERKEIIDRLLCLQDKHFCIFHENYQIVDNFTKDTSLCCYTTYNYLDSISYNSKTNELIVSLPNSTRRFLCNEDVEFTPLKLQYIYLLKNRCTKILYMYFRSYIESKESNIKGVSLLIVTLRKILGLSESYTSWHDLKRYVLAPAIREINQKSDIFIVGYKKEMEKQLGEKAFKELSEEAQIEVIINSISKKGNVGKEIEKLQLHVLDKRSDEYAKYYAPRKNKKSS